MANRNVHAGLIVVSYPSSITGLMNMLVENSHKFIEQNQPKKQISKYSDLIKPVSQLFTFITNSFFKEKIDAKKVVDNFITDLIAIRKIKGVTLKLSTTNDITHGVVFIYLADCNMKCDS